MKVGITAEWAGANAGACVCSGLPSSSQCPSYQYTSTGGISPSMICPVKIKNTGVNEMYGMHSEIGVTCIARK